MNTVFNTIYLLDLRTHNYPNFNITKIAKLKVKNYDNRCLCYALLAY